jgi:hypothetical protein
LSLMLLLRCARVPQAVYQYDKLADRKWYLVAVGHNNDLLVSMQGRKCHKVVDSLQGLWVI